MKRLYALCVVIALVLAGLTVYYRAEPDTFYGIADTKEIAITSESAVEIRRVLVAQGQLVNEGDTLLELFNPELEMRLSQISHELTEMRTRSSAHATLSKSEILQFKAQQEVRVSEIRAQIKELEAQYEMNRRLVSELHSLDRDKPANADGDAGNPILIKLESLRKLLALAQDPSRVYENRLANALSSSGDPLADQVKQMEDELRILNEDRKRLVIQAQIGGLIGSVNFKVGEKVSPFAPILTLHAASPSFVRGYIHEDVYSQVAVKQKMRVQNHQGLKVEGEVVGVGTRIVEYPERLRRRADILIWGREIIIRLPADNRFLLGEKVLISMPGKVGPPARAQSPAASAPEAHAAASAPVDIRVPELAVAGLAAGAADVPGLEASGLLYLPDLARFLVVSDDTRKKNAEVYLMDTAYRVEKTVPIRGLAKMDDMESIADGGNGSVYVLSSQNRSKHGKLAEARKLLVRAKRKGADLELQDKVVLLDALEKAAKGNPGADWSAYLKSGLADGSMDIEGMAVRDGDLYLGFKAPLRDGKAVILRVAGVDSLLAGKTPAAAVSIWKTLGLKDSAGAIACGIADLLFLSGDLYLLSTGDAPGADGAHAGELWVVRKDAAEAERLRGFAGAKPEGLAQGPGGNIYVAFDNGSRHPSQVLNIGVLK
jgi:multidrug resistance efflux pump